ncbi:MAG: FHA domain-containing protein [Clostridium sp.]|nr:FHA domain-containing protein [Clostridium sp.]
MDKIIQIKCPFCTAVLSVKYQAGIESKRVTCPICKHTYPFTEYRQVTPKSANEDPPTDYPGQKGEASGQEERTRYNDDELTDLGNRPNYTLGEIRITNSGVRFRLKPGRNVIGRKAQQSGADCQIDTGDKRSMSREHIVIEVKKEPSKGYVHYISLYKEKVNKTFIGSEPLLYGDNIILKDGDMIKLPDATLRFEIPDEEGTII